MNVNIIEWNLYLWLVTRLEKGKIEIQNRLDVQVATSIPNKEIAREITEIMTSIVRQ